MLVVHEALVLGFNCEYKHANLYVYPCYVNEITLSSTWLMLSADSVLVFEALSSTQVLINTYMIYLRPCWHCDASNIMKINFKW